MDIYTYVVADSDIDDIAEELVRDIASWIEESESKAGLVNTRDVSDGGLGLHLSIRKGRELKEPLNFLYSITKKHKLDFVFGIIEGESGDREDICYFGNEEGKPDIYEISSYIGLKV
jgi:hypothetical protein